MSKANCLNGIRSPLAVWRQKKEIQQLDKILDQHGSLLSEFSAKRKELLLDMDMVLRCEEIHWE